MSMRGYSLDRQACLLLFYEHISKTSGCASVQQISDTATVTWQGRLPLVVSDSYALIQCPFIVSVSTAVVTRALSRTNPASTWNLEPVFPLHLKLPLFSQKCLKGLEFLSHTDVLCDTVPVFRDPIDPTVCIYCHRIEFACCICNWKRCMGVCISCSHTTLCVKCTSSPLL